MPAKIDEEESFGDEFAEDSLIIPNMVPASESWVLCQEDKDKFEGEHCGKSAKGNTSTHFTGYSGNQRSDQAVQREYFSKAEERIGGPAESLARKLDQSGIVDEDDGEPIGPIIPENQSTISN